MTMDGGMYNISSFYCSAQHGTHPKHLHIYPLSLRQSLHMKIRLLGGHFMHASMY